ncbi:helix-turn-helix transcriptional regulator [Streptomyces sp. NPDC002666]
MAAARTPYLLGHAEIADLFGVARQTSQKWRVDGTLAKPDVVASGNPYWLLDTVLRLDGHARRQATAERLDQYRSSIRRGCRIEDPAALPTIVGIKEVAQLLGVDQQTVSRWRNRKQIVEADLVLSRSPLWLLDTIEADALERDRAIAPDELERLRSGEQAPQKPRGRKPAAPRSAKKVVPPARSFTSSERDEAISFISQVLSEGHSVIIRPTR